MTFQAQFANKTIALTGAASGIGLATAQLLASRGARLALADLNEQALATVKSSIESTTPGGAQVTVTALDVRSYPAVEAWIQAAKTHFGAVDAAANLAGVIPKSIGVAPLSEQDFEEWDFVQGVNLTGVMHCLRAQLRLVEDGGSIVNASSIAGLTGRANNGAYAASKHGVVGLTRSAAKEVGRRGVRVNCICPGRIDTPMSRAASSMPAGPEISMGRLGTADEVAKLVAFLLSDESSYISGNAISIDGGWNC